MHLQTSVTTPTRSIDNELISAIGTNVRSTSKTPLIYKRSITTRTGMHKLILSHTTGTIFIRHPLLFTNPFLNLALQTRSIVMRVNLPGLLTMKKCHVGIDMSATKWSATIVMCFRVHHQILRSRETHAICIRISTTTITRNSPGIH